VIVKVTERVDKHFADVVGTVEDLGVGEAQAAQTRPRVGLIATEVHRLLGGGPVVAEAVGLDDEVQRGPEEVDPIAPEAALGLGRRKARFSRPRRSTSGRPTA
jgi:hypothetical protein